ncbi:PAAR domain-containing protein [Polyangium mundeleinium]|uniref:PAAR domain-containing protein n=1 Tax=Polyangium mundeleinium TaxID=2995306 RepID=A0ABT5F463_9BACT|nr:PAAR domain-containing protein [Polyangium mundeleinium]MDC0748880.1 PAAR domain-containing protein [Polyangium mundeleinium]
MSGPPPAARVGDAIEHSNALLGAITGIAMGLAIGVAIGVAGILTVATGGLAAVAFAVIGAAAMACTGAVAGFSFGEWIGQKSKSISGVIREGAKTVFIGQGCPPAARAFDRLACGDPPVTPGKVAVAALLGPLGMIGLGIYSFSRADHGDARIATGSKTVYIERFNAARETDETDCSGKIVQGCKTVRIGGPKIELIPRSRWRPEISQEFRDWMTLVDRVGVVLGILSGFGSIRVIFTQGIKGFIPAIRSLSSSQRWDIGLALGDGGLWLAETYGGLNPWVRTIYETGTLGRSGWLARPGRGGTPDLPTAPRAGTPDLPTAPRAGTPDLPTAPRVDAPNVPPTPPRAVPQGGQSISERMAQGGNPPPYARQNPDNYFYDPAAGRYKRRP